MKHRRFFFLICLSLIITGTAFSENMSEQKLRSDIKEFVSKMSLQEKLGQMCLMNFRLWEKEKSGDFKNISVEADKKELEGLSEINDTIREAVLKYKFGNVIFFPENLEEKDKAVQLVKDFSELSLKASGIPMLFAIDQEGGNVNRIYSKAVMPSAMAVGFTKNPENAFTAGYITALEMKNYGINCNLAPVCDVSSNIKNPVIGIRSYSDNPEEVSVYASKMHEGLRKGKIISTAKHFPGHGDTDTDSHLSLPVIKKTRAAWNATEKIPFQKLIDSEIPMIMTAHIQFPKLDDSKIKSSKTKRKIIRPATLSRKILTDLLRTEMNFKGVVVTDAMDMLAIKNNFTEAEAFIESVNAGADLICHPINIYTKSALITCDNFFEEITKAVHDGSLPEERINQAVERILYMKAEYGLLPEITRSPYPAFRTYIELSNEYISETVKQMQKEAILNTWNPSPFTDANSKSGKYLILVPKRNAIPKVKNHLVQVHPELDYELYCFEKETQLTASLKEKIKASDRIILFTHLDGYAVRNPKLSAASMPFKIARLIRQQKKQAATYAVSLCLPYDQNNFSDLNYFATCNYREEAVQCALDFILER